MPFRNCKKLSCWWTFLPLPVSLSFSVFSGNDVMMWDTLIKFSRGNPTTPQSAWLLCHHTNTHTHSASCCGVVRNPAACSVARLTTGLFCVSFILVDALLFPCSARTMGPFTCGQKANTHADMDTSFRFASSLAFWSIETWVFFFTVLGSQ